MLALCLVPALVGGCAGAEGTDRPVRKGEVAWDRAGSHEGETVRVCGPLRGTGSTQDATFLNLGVDHPDPERFTVVIWEAAPRRSWSVGARVCARGTGEAFEDIHEMQFDSLRTFDASSTVR